MEIQSRSARVPSRDSAHGDFFSAACAAALASTAETGAATEKLRALALAWLEVDLARLRRAIADADARLPGAKGRERGARVESRRRLLMDLERLKTRAPELAPIRGLPGFQALFLEK